MPYIRILAFVFPLIFLLMRQAFQENQSTVLVTGGTQGIGLELAKIFAKEGYNVVLVGRDKAKTEEVASRIAATFKVQVTPLVQDLAELEAAEKLHAAVLAAGISVDILINNAGFGIAGDFLTTQLDYEIGMMRLNMETVVRLTKLFLPDMVGKKGGRILNVASLAGFQPGPFMSVYSATKAFVLSFSEALADELQGKRITVTALCPGATKTGFQANARMDELRDVKGTAADPYIVAMAGYRGLMRGKAVVVPGFKNQCLILLERFLPRATVARVTGGMMRRMANKDN